MAQFVELWKQRGEKYSALIPLSVAGFEYNNIVKAFENITDEQADLLFQQMNYFAEMTYPKVLESYGEASYNGAPFYGYIGYNGIPIHGRMKLYPSTVWTLYDMKVEEVKHEKQEVAAETVVEEIVEEYYPPEPGTYGDC